MYSFMICLYEESGQRNRGTMLTISLNRNTGSQCIVHFLIFLYIGNPFMEL